MAFKMKGSSLYGKLNLNRGGQASKPDGRAKSSAFQKAGVFVDGERVTYKTGRKTETEGGNVTYTNKDADNRNKEDLSSTDKNIKMNAEQYVQNTTGKNRYKGEKGEKRDFDIAQKEDAKAQELLERRTRNKNRRGKKNAGKMDEEGRKGSNAKIASEKAFEDRNKNIKTVEGKLKDGTKTQSVKGASTTINKGGANKGVFSTKNKSDYDKEKKNGGKGKSKKKNKNTRATYIRDVRD